MPNGSDRNFIRFISCIGSFRAKFNKWPTSVRVGPSFMEELKEVMTKEDYKKMNHKIAIALDYSNPFDGLYIAEDDEGNIYDLMQNGHISGKIDVIDWLGIKWPKYGV